MKSWEKLQKLFDNKERVKGFIVGKAKAGLYVKIMGTNAFLPLSQIDVRPVRDVSHLIKTEETFEILKMDYSKGNIVVSRKSVLSESLSIDKSELLEKIKEVLPQLRKDFFLDVPFQDNNEKILLVLEGLINLDLLKIDKLNMISWNQNEEEHDVAKMFSTIWLENLPS